jgi:formylglycine-generating enzyme required for sulfatase activity
MKIRMYCLFVMLAMAVSFPAIAQLPTIVSLSQDGTLVCTNLNPGSIAAVAWAPSLGGPWETNLPGLNAVAVGLDESIQVTVPMTNSGPVFYRVLGMAAAPTGMALIPAGSFTMGDTLDGETDAVPITVYVSDFYIDTNLVTYSLWQSIFTYAMGKGYSFDDMGAGKAPNHPVQTVSWYDTVKWCNAWSQQAGLTPVYYTDAGLTMAYTNGDTDLVYPNWSANGYRLPTEAEWEKAAQGGLSGQRFPWGDTISESQADYYGNTTTYSYDLGPDGPNANYTSGGLPFTSPVGSFAPNGYGLNDMAGNVWEWCWDWYGTPYGQPTANNPMGPASGTRRVVRGGSWLNYANAARCASRSNYSPVNAQDFVGFRCVRSH